MNNQAFRNFIIAVILFITCQLSASVRPFDQVYLPSLNQTYYLSNETYIFDLIPDKLIPLNIKKHIIYTGSTGEINRITKRTLFENRKNLFEFSEEDHEKLKEILYENDQDKIPPFIKVNKKKRSLPVSDNGVGSIPLATGFSIIHYPDENEDSGEKSFGKKRADKIQVGTKFCLSIPAFTTCTNDGGTQEVKDAITGSVTALRKELDSYTSTNNLRDKTLGDTLTKQSTLVGQLIALSGELPDYIVPSIIEHESVNVVNAAHGDYVAQAQINYLKRVTSAILTFLRSMASTDGRQVVAQPSLSQLFTSYKAVLADLTKKNLIPIVESRTFNWTEVPLPTDLANNTAMPPKSSALWDANTQQSYRGMNIWIKNYDCNAVTGALFSQKCLDNIAPQFNCKCKNDKSFIDSEMDTGENGVYNYFYGPLPQSLIGLYKVGIPSTVNITYPTRYIAYRSFPYLDTDIDPSYYRVNDAKSKPATPKMWYCVQFGAYIGLADFTDTPYMVNGIPAGSKVLNASYCDPLRLRYATGNIIYSLYAIKEKVIIPFYSNCTAKQLISQNVITGSQKIGYYSQYPTGYAFGDNSPVIPDDLDSSSIDRLDNLDMFQYNMISATCAMNLNPEWIGGKYFNKKPNVTISNIPTGFKFDQFTINPFGELSSSLQFVYTTKWVQTYQISRSSTNSMVTDEVDILHGTRVLFYVNKNESTVIDEADNFFGEGNNGRDCIQKSDNYNFDLTSCLYQNDLLRYSADNYFLGLQKTTGVARFIDKYSFTFKTTASSPQDKYSFTLIPKDDADFRFYIESDGKVCPKLISRESSTSDCTFTFFYNGTKPNDIKFANQPVVFSQNFATVYTQTGLHRLVIGAQECLLVNCKFTQTYSLVELEPPPYVLIQQSDLNLQTQISNTFESINSTLQILDDASETSDNLREQNLILQQQLAQLNFTYYLLHEYENFTALRAEVDKYIDAIAPIQPSYNFDFSDCDSGVFGSIGCFFSNLFSTIVTILIIAAIFIGIYVVCFKFGVGKKIMGKLKF